MVIRKGINEVIVGHHPEYLLPLVLIAAVALFLQHGLNSLRLLLNNTFEQKVIFDLRSDLYSHIQLLPLRWFDNRATGDLMTRILEDVTSMERVLIDGIDQGTVAVLQILIAVTFMFYLSAKLALVALAPVPFLAGGALWYTLTAHRRYRLQRRAASAMNSLLHDNLSGIRQIKSFVREGDEHMRFNEASDALRRSHSRSDENLGNLQPLDVFVRLARRFASRRGWDARYLGGGDQFGRSHRLSYMLRFSLRTGGQIASAQPTYPGRTGGG